MEYSNIPLKDCPQSALDLFNDMLRELVKSINGMPVECGVYGGGIVVSLPKVFSHRPCILAQIHKSTFIECLRLLRTITINDAGLLDSTQYKQESEVYSIIHEELQRAKHIELEDCRCAVCYVYTRNTVHKTSHPICNRCILKVDKCPICRQPIEKDEDEDSNYSDTDIDDEL